MAAPSDKASGAMPSHPGSVPVTVLVGIYDRFRAWGDRVTVVDESAAIDPTNPLANRWRRKYHDIVCDEL